MNLQFPCFITHVKGIMHRQETLHKVCILSRVHLQRLDMPAVWVILTAVSMSLGRERVKQDAFCCHKLLKVFIKKMLMPSAQHTHQDLARVSRIQQDPTVCTCGMVQKCVLVFHTRTAGDVIGHHTSLKSLRPKGICFRCLSFSNVGKY